MKLDWTQTFVDEQARPVVRKVEGTDETKVLTLGDLVIAACNSWDPQSKITPEEKYDRYEIIKAVKETGELTIPQLNTVRKAVGEHGFLPFIHGQIIDMIDQKDTGLKVLTGGKK